MSNHQFMGTFIPHSGADEEALTQEQAVFYTFYSIKFESKKGHIFPCCCLLLSWLFRLNMCIFAFYVFLGVLLVCAPCQCLGCLLGCECFAVTHTVKCISKSLLRVPQNIPGYARTVFITGNNIHQIGADSFTELENVSNVILSNNRWEYLLCFSFMYIKHDYVNVYIINKWCLCQWMLLLFEMC